MADVRQIFTSPASDKELNVYYCGYRDIASLLFFTTFYDDTASGAGGGYIPADPETFSLPGDKPAYAPDRPADVAHVDIDVTLDFAEESVRGVVTTKFSTLFEEILEITLDAAELQIEQVSLDTTGTPLTFWVEGEKLHIRLDRPYWHGEEFGVKVKYSAHPRTGLVFVKPTEGNPDLPVQAWTQGETEYHHHWFVCHDFPNDRATTTLHATVPANFFALSNGRLEEIREN